MKPTELTTIYRGQHLTMLARGSWEFVTRNTQLPAVGIVAITDDGQVLLVEQWRPPVERRVVELPAGLAGDIPGAEHEALLEAAKRELLEETGYVARQWTELGGHYSSPGLTDESIVFFMAEGLERQHDGGGDEMESIIVHHVPIDHVMQWLRDQQAATDLKTPAGLFAALEQLRMR